MSFTDTRGRELRGASATRASEPTIDPFALASCSFAGLAWVLAVPGVLGPLAVALGSVSLARQRPEAGWQGRTVAWIGVVSGALASLSAVLAMLVFVGSLNQAG